MPDTKKPTSSSSDDAQGNKANEGPDRLAPSLDDSNEWQNVASDKGFQQGDQGGYKGSYDETKYQQVKDKDVNPDETRKMRENAHATGNVESRGDDDGQKSPLTQNERTQDKRTKD